MDEIAAQRFRDAVGDLSMKLGEAQQTLAFLLGGIEGMSCERLVRDFEAQLSEQRDHAAFLARSVNVALERAVRDWHRQHPSAA